MAIPEEIIKHHNYKLIYYGDTFCIKGRYELASYDEDSIAVKCIGELIYIKGDKICVSSLDADAIYIKGKIQSISFS